MVFFIELLLGEELLDSGEEAKLLVGLAIKASFESGELFVHGSRNVIANLGIELLDVLNIGLPGGNVDRKKLGDGVPGDVKTVNVDIGSVRNVTDSRLNGINLILATSKDPEEDTHIVTEAGPYEVTFIICTEPVNVENLRSLIA